MKWTRWIAGISLAAFLWLGFAQSFHQHAANQTSHQCALCTVVHRTPVLANAATSLPHVITQNRFQVSTLEVYAPSFLTEPSGRSPPVL